MKILSFLTLVIFLQGCGLLSQDEPNITGKIVFAAVDNDEIPNYQIYTMNADGSNVKQLTYWETSSMQPSWSPDGSRIIFSSFKQSTSIGPTLWVMNADGSNKHVLYDAEPDNIHVPPLAGRNAQWSPDGSKVVFDLCVNCSVATNYNIFVFDTETQTLTQLTDHPGSESNPTWSPDGKKITFISDREYPNDYAFDLYVINIDGSNLIRLTNLGSTREPIWNKNTIAFRSTGISSGIYKIDLKTSEINRVKQDLTERVQLHPNAWSPDGKHLMITAWELDEPHTNTLYILNLKTNKLKNIYSRIYENTIGIQGADWFAQGEN